MILRTVTFYWTCKRWGKTDHQAELYRRAKTITIVEQAVILSKQQTQGNRSRENEHRNKNSCRTGHLGRNQIHHLTNATNPTFGLGAKRCALMRWKRSCFPEFAMHMGVRPICLPASCVLHSLIFILPYFQMYGPHTFDKFLNCSTSMTRPCYDGALKCGIVLWHVTLCYTTL